MSNTPTKENKMGVMPIPKLLITMSLPMILSMLVQALYNVVDSIFVAKLSEDALTAVSLAFPIQNLMIAISAGTGVGINALLSRYLGEHRFDDANKVAKNGIFLALISSAIFALIAYKRSHVCNADRQSGYRNLWNSIYANHHILFHRYFHADYFRTTDAIYRKNIL